MTDDEKNELLRLAERLVWTAKSAAHKIEIERMRGAGYYHAEVDWLLELMPAMRGFIRAVRAPNHGLPDTASADDLVEKYANLGSDEFSGNSLQEKP